MRAAPIKSLADLKQVQRQIEARAKVEAQALARQAELLRRQQAEQNLFQRAVGPVQPMAQPRRAALKKAAPQPVPVQQQRDDQAVLVEAISDQFDAGTLLDVDEDLSFRRPGIGPDVTRKLRKGEWSVQRQLDLHGLRSEEARDALSRFIREAHKQGLRCVRVVHGKGLGSPGKSPVLKSKVHSWLVQKKQVLAFVQARPLEGGAGALLVLLAPG
jgi:DNA-nicking Smr family endonuclease